MGDSMKKLTSKIFISLVCVFLLFLSVFLFNNSLAIPDNENDKVLQEINKLENYANEYIEKYDSNIPATELCFQYIRRNRYNDEKWKALLGNIDTEFVTYVDSKGGIDISDDTVIIEETTYKEIDFVHMIAVLSCYYKYGQRVALATNYSISTDYAGWAGDLLTYLKEINNYRISKNITEYDDLFSYSQGLLGTNRKSTFDSKDIYADLDALNIYNCDDIDLNNLTESLERYYISASSTYNYKNRVISAQNYFGDNEIAIKKNVKDLITNLVVQKYFFADTVNSITDLDYDVVVQSFTDYIMGNPYIEISSTSGNSTVGDEAIKVPIIESNLGVPKIKLSNAICEVEFIDDIMYIRATNAGNTIITISSEHQQKSVEYHLTAYNIEPSIKTDLLDTYELSKGIESNISIEAGGTNNTYTWYIVDKEGIKTAQLAETAIPNININPSEEMDGKYLECIVSNDGNSDAISKKAYLRVQNASFVDIVKTGDTTLNLAFSILFFVFCSNVFVYSIKNYLLI